MTRATLEFDGVTYEISVSGQGLDHTVTVDGQPIPVRLERNGSGTLATAGGKTLHVELGPASCRLDGRAHGWRIVTIASTKEEAAASGARGASVRAPMNGKLERILVVPGQLVAKGDVLFVLEAMKMQNDVRSPASGTVRTVNGTLGMAVEPSQVIIEIDGA